MNVQRDHQHHDQERATASDSLLKPSGRVIVMLTLSLFLVVPAITYLVWSLTQGEPTRVKLDYDRRAEWFMQPVKPRPLSYSTFVAAETGKEYKKTDLQLTPDTERVLQHCVNLAKRDDFANPEVRDDLAKLVDREDAGFYPAYLLATWHLLNEQRDEHDKWMRVAYERAGGALAQRLIDEKGKPVAGYRLPPVAIGYDRVIDGKRDATLVLVYPHPTSDKNGFVYLPTYRSVYRLTDPKIPMGALANVHPIQLTLLPQPSEGKDQPNWFAVPDGAVGRFADAVVEREE